jgi:transposase
MTEDLLCLGDWLAALGVTHVAMESTGVYWKPIWNLLEDRFTLLLCNAQHIKQVPGRKTDAKDCEWIAQLLQYGLLRASFVPPAPMRELRELTRQRVQLINEKSAVVNRIQKILEDANIKLAGVASSVVGVSGRLMIAAMIAGVDDPEVLAQMAHGRMVRKIPQLQQALKGRVTDHHRFLLDMLLEHLEHLEAMVDRLSARIAQTLDAEALSTSQSAPDALPFAQASDLLITIPGVDRRVAECILAEIGTDMSRFPTAGHIASWAGLCPGNNKSAGKRQSGTTTKGDRWLQGTLTQAAWAASHVKTSYLSAQYKRIAGRRGKKRALIAVAHSILVSAYHMLSRGTPYDDLGADYYTKLAPVRQQRSLVKRLEAMGYTVALTPA